MGGTLLLADDSITIQKVVELTFAETEHKVIAVGGGRELFKRLPEVKPDVVLCDVVMPDMNGYDVCQTLKSDPATLHIPVVLLTGTFEPFDRDRALAAGCDGIVTKPFEARELVTVVEELLKRVRSTAAAPIPEEASGIPDQGIPEGVPSLDFTTTGFDKMGVPPPAPEPTPDDGMDLTASALGNSHPKTPRPAPPELQEPAAGTVPTAFALVEPAPPPLAEPAAVPEPPAPAVPEAPVFAEAAAEPFGTVSIRPVPLPPPEPTLEAAAPPPEAGPVFAPAESAMEKAPTQRFLVQEAEAPVPPVVEAPAPPAAAPQPSAVAEAPAATALSDEAVERIARRAAELLPAPPAPVSTSSQLSEGEIDRIARRVVELAGPQLERIAWEVLPDMAEIVVRKRIRELEAAAEEEK